MPGLTRRRLLTLVARGTTGIVLARLLVACGQRSTPQGTVLPGQRAAPPGGTPRSGTPLVVASPVVEVPATVALATATATEAAAPVSYGCPARDYQVTPSSSDPYLYTIFVEGGAISFADRVRKYADLIVLINKGQKLSPRWTTADGRRPANPYAERDLGPPAYTIITPERAEVVKVAKGRYDLPAIYVAHFGGRIGRDCVDSSDSLYLGGGPAGTQYLWLLSLATYPEARPVADDPRYRFYSLTRSYPVSPSNTITIGPEHDIMGNWRDNPPRTLMVDEVLREIAALLATPAATPTR
jgi:hypothetical protein